MKSYLVVLIRLRISHQVLFQNVFDLCRIYSGKPGFWPDPYKRDNHPKESRWKTKNINRDAAVRQTKGIPSLPSRFSCYANTKTNKKCRQEAVEYEYYKEDSALNAHD